MIRRAADRDTPVLVSMAVDFLGQTIYGAVLSHVDRDLVAQMVDSVRTHGALFVADWLPAPGRSTVIGMLGMVAGAHPASGDRYAEELAWWVEPQWRQSTVGSRLIDAGEAWARQTGATLVKMVAPAGSTVGQFYERRGYVATETAYVKRF